jgi:nicotinamidase-related amidase
MRYGTKLNQNKCGLLILDMQRGLLSQIDRGEVILSRVLLLARGAKELGLPILYTEQYGHQESVDSVQELLAEQVSLQKMSFSALAEPEIKAELLCKEVSQWIVVGLEAHVSVLQTVRDLVESEKEVIVPNDAIGSQSLFDYSTGIGEMRDFGARITCTETILFELLQSAKHPSFQVIKELLNREDGVLVGS